MSINSAFRVHLRHIPLDELPRHDELSGAGLHTTTHRGMADAGIPKTEMVAQLDTNGDGNISA